MKLQPKTHLPGNPSSLLMAILLICLTALLTNAQELADKDSKPCKAMVVGFVGGMRSPDDQTQGVVQIGNRLRNLDYSDLQVRIYRHWHWRSVYKSVYQEIDRDRDNSLSKEEIMLAPKIVIYGHSLGGWAVIKLSRKLEKQGIAVDLTVQVDSVGIGDEVVPNNVKSAANFYQRTLLLLRGEKRVRAKDENKTKVIGNYLIKGVGHENLARQVEVSDFVTERIQLLCESATLACSKGRKLNAKRFD